MKPLTIGIPTYNRANLLQSALLSLIPQINEHSDEVELVVSDNNSSDNTKEIVDLAREKCPIIYHCNAENIGANKNIVSIPAMASGEFCWILGDDDFVRPGAVKQILGIIKANPEIDYIYANIAHLPLKRLQRMKQPISSSDISVQWLELGSKDQSCYYVDSWENLVDPKISDVFLGAIMVSVVRTSIWKRYSGLLDIKDFASSFDSVYPHIRIFANGLVGKHAYYIGTPLVVVVDGAREWTNYVPKICLVYLHEAIDLYEQCGVPADNIEKCRRYLVRNNQGLVSEMLHGKTFEGLDEFNVHDYISRYRRYFTVPFFI